MSVRRPKTKTKTCAHCKRRRPRLKIEWHPGIWEWQCSDFRSCDKAIEHLKERLIEAADKAFWKITRYKPGQKLDMSKPRDQAMARTWFDIHKQIKEHGYAKEIS